MDYTRKSYNVLKLLLDITMQLMSKIVTIVTVNPIILRSQPIVLEQHPCLSVARCHIRL